MTSSELNINTNPEIGQQVQAVAENYGVELSQDRLGGLVAQAKRLADTMAAGDKAAFVQDGLMIAPPAELPGTDETISQVHFMPKTKAAPRGATVTQRKESMGVIRRGLTALQDYALLVGAGLAPAPTRLFGHTNNQEMTAIAQRFGFMETDVGSGDVAASFQVVRDYVLSPESVRLEKALAQRTARAAGDASLRSTVGQSQS